MANRIFNIVGWLGTALVLAAVGVRFLLPAKDQYATYLAWAGLACMLVYIGSQWREVAAFFSRRQARDGTLAASGGGQATINAVLLSEFEKIEGVDADGVKGVGNVVFTGAGKGWVNGVTRPLAVRFGYNQAANVSSVGPSANK